MFWGVENIVQVAFVVRDLDAAVRRWVSKGAGPFRDFGKIDVALYFRGDPVTVSLSLALGHCDGVQIELVQLHDAEASVFRMSFPDAWPEEGLQHVGMIAADYDRFVDSWAAEGKPLIMNGSFSGYRFGFIDTRDTLGFMLEIFEKTPTLTAFFAEIANLKAGWDGESPYA